MSDPHDDFAALAGRLDYQMLIVTAKSRGEQAGCLVGFATQCSIDPPRYLVCLSDKNHTYRVAAGADSLAVHLVPQEATHLAQLFGSETDDETDKFARCQWHAGPEQLPILEECPTWFAGRIIDTQRLGDHVGFVLAPFAATAADPGTNGFVTFQQVKRLDPGHDA